MTGYFQPSRQLWPLIPILLFLPVDSPAAEILGAGDDSLTLDTIVVTATKREQDLDHVPIGMTALGGYELERIGAMHFEDYARSVPGVSFTKWGLGGPKVVIRGISSSTYPEVNPLTGLYLDEIPMARPASTGIPFAPDVTLIDVDRIEILRGPQGTLFGDHSMGGAVRIITNQPDSARFEGKAEGLMSSTDEGGTNFGANLTLNLPVSDRSALRGSLYYLDENGFIDNIETGRDDVNDNRTTGLRLAGKIHMNDRLALTGRLLHHDAETHGRTGDDSFGDYLQYTVLPEPIEDQWTQYNAVVEYDLGWGDLLSSTSYYDRTVTIEKDVSPFMGFFGFETTLAAHNMEDAQEFVQEIRIASKPGRLSWLGGLYYMNRDHRFAQRFPSQDFDTTHPDVDTLSGETDLLYKGGMDNKVGETALFGEATWQLAPSIDISVGGRWFRTRHESDFSAQGYFLGGSFESTSTTDEDGVNPKLAMTWRLSDSAMVYGTVARGFRAGGVIAEVPPPGFCDDELADLGYSSFPDTYDSDHLWNYEFGTRTNWLDDRLSLDASVFHIDWSDMQTMGTLQCGYVFQENVGKASSQGVEVALTVRPTAMLRLGLRATVIDAKLDEDVADLGSKGDRLPGISSTTGNVFVDYRYPAFADLRGFVRADLEFVSSFPSDFLRPRHTSSGYDLLSLRLGVQSDLWRAELYGTNLLDDYIELMYVDSIIGRWSTPNRPRTIGVRIISWF